MMVSGFVAVPASFAMPPKPTTTLAVDPQYDTPHAYVAPEDFDRFTDSSVATFGGNKSKQGVFQVTPTCSAMVTSTSPQSVQSKSACASWQTSSWFRVKFAGKLALGAVQDS